MLRPRSSPRLATEMAGQATWQPRACRLQLYEPKELQQVFHGKHFLVIGDSTTHMLMATMMRMILGADFRYPTNGRDLCGHDNRVYDSGDMLFPVRFSFLWAGAAGYCGNNGGLPSVLETRRASLGSAEVGQGCRLCGYEFRRPRFVWWGLAGRL